MVRFAGGLMGMVDAPDYSRTPFSLVLNGSEGRALTGMREVRIEYWDGRREHWPSAVEETSSMDRAVAEIVAWLEGGGTFSYPAAEALHVLEIIVAFHASHARKAAWVELPLAGTDREIVVHSG